MRWKSSEIMPNYKNILIIKLSSIGDVVHALPFLEVLKKSCPDSRIDWLVEEEASQVISGHPAITRIIISGRKRWQKNILNPFKFLKISSEAIRFYKELRLSSYDIVIDLQGLFRSGFLTALSRGKRKIGMSGGREGASLFLKEAPVAVDYDQHAIDRYLKVAGHLGCDTGVRKGEIPVSEEDKKLADGIFASFSGGETIIAVNPMAKWKTKLWKPDKFSQLAERLQKEINCRIIFTGSVQDRPIIEDIIKQTGGKQDQIINLAGSTTLKELAYLYSGCSVLICTDTGPMHIAAAMNCRVVALFGPTAPLRTGPYGNGHKIIRSGIDCSPCFKKECGNIKCMDDITVTAVFDAVRSIILSGVKESRGKEVK
ncbi:MAG: lipopolysaccharide heptosyltransferase II [Proteobacteria bacterium]|nr:lipopolysaccharide heptosyltransferase II [Pseudomonadota bacterium]